MESARILVIGSLIRAALHSSFIPTDMLGPVEATDGDHPDWLRMCGYYSSLPGRILYAGSLLALQPDSALLIHASCWR